jgi:hypothetical protein
MSATLSLNPAPIKLSPRPVAAADNVEDVVELALVLPRWQMEELAAASRHHGLTAGQAIRRLIRGFCTDHQRPDR